MKKGKEIDSKLEIKKKEKESKLLDSAYKLFIKKGINNTTIQDIVDDAGVAKGTFYLYFKDKYTLQEQLIIEKSYQLFNEALKSLDHSEVDLFEDKIIFIINYVIDELIKNPVLIKFISKDLSLGLYSEKITNLIGSSKIGLKELFLKEVKASKIKLINPEVTLFMIIELVSSTCFTTITKKQPLNIEEYKPILYNTIRKIITSD